jgi:hypothetical protein
MIGQLKSNMTSRLAEIFIVRVLLCESSQHDLGRCGHVDGSQVQAGRAAVEGFVRP